jgi:predicted secreted protein
VKIVRNKGTFLVSVLLMLGLGLNSAQATTTTTLSEKNASKTIAVKLGARVELTLHSMYWGLAVPAKSSSLTSKGAPILKPIFPSATAPAGCKIAGSGCGTQTWEFVATKVGTTHLVASRTTCGEAMKCTGANGRFTVTVKVSR